MTAAVEPAALRPGVDAQERGQSSCSRPSVISAVDALEVLEVGELDRRPCPACAPIVDAAPACRGSPTAAPRARAGRAAAAGRRGRPSPGRRRRSAPRPLGLGCVPRTASSTSRTDSSSATARRASASWKARSGVPSSARAWPAVSCAVGHERLDRRRQLEQAQRVGHRRAALADPRRHLVLGEAEVLDQLLVGRRLLERVEVLRGGGSRPAPARATAASSTVADDGRDRRQAGPLGRPPPALAGDQLVAVVADRPDQDRLEHAELARSTRSARPAPPRRSGAEAGAGWARCRSTGSSLQREPDRPRSPPTRPVGDQGPEALTQPAAACHRSPPWPAPGRRWRPGSSDRTR